MTSTREIWPLRRVGHVEASQKRGKDLNPHYFWLAREFSLHLECGHVDVRVKNVTAMRSATTTAGIIASFPQRVRCSQCPPKTVSTRPAPHQPDPPFDPIAGALAATAMRLVPDRQDDLLAWVARYGRWLSDESQRSRAHGAVALHLIDTYTPTAESFDLNPSRAGWPQAHAVREAVARWAHDPTGANRTAVQRAARRAYDGQNTRRLDNNWIARRGIIAAAKVSSKTPHNVEGILEAITWDHQTRTSFYDQLWDLRHELDRVRATEVETPLPAENGPLGAWTRAAFAQRESTLIENLHNLYDQGYPAAEIQHLPLMLACIDAYQKSISAPAVP